MKINTYIPSDTLRPFILTYIIVESTEELVNKVLPDTSMVLAFKFKGNLNYIVDTTQNDLPSASLSGLRKSLRLYNYSKNTGNILVLFKDGGAASFFKTELHELYDECVTLENFIPHQKLSEIEEQLAEAKSNPERIVLIENFLLSQLRAQKPDILIIDAVQKIQAAKGMIRMKDLADSFSLSQDAFEKRFRRLMGTSPKQFSNLLRMISITNAGSQKSKLIKLALEAGYFDQAHFNKDFKSFTGQTPTEFFTRPTFLQINDFLQ